MSNTQTSVPAFTAGQVLTAAQMTEVNTGIPVFATTTTRDAAFGGTGEKTLAEGQFAYIEATNTTQYYDGATWQTVGQTPGLIYLTGASFTSVASVSIPTDTFTATYTNYKIFLEVTAFSTGASLGMRMRAAGTDNTADAYRYGTLGLYSTGATSNANGDAGVTQWANLTEANTEQMAAEITIFNPKTTAKPKRMNAQTVFNRTGAPYFAFRTYGANLDSTTSFDACSFFPSAGNITGSYKVYGVSNS